MKMQPIMIPEFPRLRGEEAIKALHDFINELEEQRGKKLTEKQTTALIELAKRLISLIEAEKPLDTSDKETKERRFVTQLKKTIMKYVPESVRAHGNGRLWKLTR